MSSVSSSRSRTFCQQAVFAESNLLILRLKNDVSNLPVLTRPPPTSLWTHLLWESQSRKRQELHIIRRKHSQVLFLQLLLSLLNFVSRWRRAERLQSLIREEKAGVCVLYLYLEGQSQHTDLHWSHSIYNPPNLLILIHFFCVFGWI